MQSRMRRGRGALLWTAAALVASGGMAAGATGAHAANRAPIHGALASFAIAAQDAPAQLLAGSDGRIWFVTASSALGRIANDGTATLTGVTLPAGSEFGTATPARLAAAGPAGVWAYASTVAQSPAVDSCSVELVRSGGSLMRVTLPTGLADFYCVSGAGDTAGSLWLGMESGRFLSMCHCRVSMVVQVTPAGTVSLYPPVRMGARPEAVVLGADGAIWVLEGYDTESLGRYTAGGTPTDVPLPPGAFTDLLARPDGTFWLLSERFCSGLNPPFCPTVAIATSTGSVTRTGIYPVSRPGSSSLQDVTAAGIDGGLWMAGRQSTGPYRLFRMDASGQIDRSAGLLSPTATPLQTTGPLTITPAGVLWAAATDGAAMFLVRYRPA